MEVIPWLSGKMRLALEWGSAPELISGVPLHSGQYAERRLKKATSHVTMLNPIPTRITFTANGSGFVKNITSAVTVVIKPRKNNAAKKTATWKGPLDGRERARRTVDPAFDKSLVRSLPPKSI